jgi:hypothetical protein
VNRNYFTLPVAILGLVAVAAPHAAAQSTWTGSVSGSWNNSNNWLPASSINMQLTFGATSNAVITDDIPSTFLLNKLTFNAGDPAYMLTGNPLGFRTNSGAVLPAIVMNSANGVTIGNTFSPFVLTNNMIVNGTGTGTLAINGTMSGGGSLTYAGARDEASGRQAAEAIKTQGGKATFMGLDVIDSASIRSAASNFATIADHLDVLVNNAGIYPDKGLTILTLPRDGPRRVHPGSLTRRLGAIR